MITNENNIVENAFIDENKDDDTVTPWVVKTTSEKGVDYNKIIGKFLLFKFFIVF